MLALARVGSHRVDLPRVVRGLFSRPAGFVPSYFAVPIADIVI